MSRLVIFSIIFSLSLPMYPIGADDDTLKNETYIDEVNQLSKNKDRYDCMFGFGFSKFIYDKKSQLLINNHLNPNLHMTVFRNSFFLDLYAAFGDALIKEPILLANGDMFRSNTNVRHINWGFTFGHTFDIKNKISLNPYGGIFRQDFDFFTDNKLEDLNKEYYSKFGFAIGFSVFKYIYTNRKNGNSWIIILNNYYNLTNMSEMYYKFGNNRYVIELGIGFKFNDQ